MCFISMNVVVFATKSFKILRVSVCYCFIVYVFRCLFTCLCRSRLKNNLSLEVTSGQRKHECEFIDVVRQCVAPQLYKLKLLPNSLTHHANICFRESSEKESPFH